MKKLIREGALILFVLVVGLGASQMKAQTAVSWTGPNPPGTGGAGNWSTAGDWSTGVVPNDAGDLFFNVTIANAPTADTVTLDTSPTVIGLTLGTSSTLLTALPLTLATTTIQNGGTIEFLGGGTLSALALATNSGIINLTGGATGSFANVNNSGLVEVGTGAGFGTMNVTSTFTNNSGGTLLLASQFAMANINALANLGTVTLATDSFLNLTGGGPGITTVAAGATLNVGGTLNVINSGVATNGLGSLTSVQGTLNLTNGAVTAVLPADDNFTLSVGASGTLNVGNASTLTITGSVNNAGLFETGAGTAGGSAVSGGTFINDAGATLALKDSGDSVNFGTLSNSGTVTVDQGATLNLMATTASVNSDTISVQGGTLAAANFDNSGTVAALVSSSGSSLSSISVAGTLANETGGMFDLAQPGSVANVGILSNSGTVVIGSGATLNLTHQVSGILDIGAGSEIDVAGSFNNTAGSITVGALNLLSSVEGTLVLENGQVNQLMPSSGLLTVSSTGNINVQQSTTLTVNGSVANSGMIATNEGNLAGGQDNTVNVTGTLTNNSGGQFLVGDFDDTHDVANLGTLANNGSVYVGAGATLNVENALTSIATGSSLTIAGAFNQTNGVGGSVAGSGLAALVTVGGALALENGQTNTVVSQVAPQSGQVSTLAVGAGGQLTLSGAGTTLSVQDMFFSNAGTVSIGPGTALNLVDTGANLGMDFTLNEGIDLRVVDADTISAAETLTVGGSFNIVFSGTGESENALGLLQEVSGILNLQNGQTTTVTTPVGAFGELNITGGQINLSGGTTLNVEEILGNGGVVTTGSQGGNNTLFALDFQNSGTLNLEGSGDQAIFNTFENFNGTTTIGSGAELTAGPTYNGATIQVNPGGTLVTNGSIQNLGALNLGLNGATGPQAAATLVVGGGSVNLFGLTSQFTLGGGFNLFNASDVITTDAPGGLLANYLTIQGTGNIGDGQMQILNDGNIFANATALETANNGTLLTVEPNGGGFTNNGGMQANAGNTLQIDVSDISFTGTSGAFGFTNNNVVNAYGTVELTDRDPNTSVNLGNNGVIDVGGSGSGTLEFNGENTQFNLFGDGNITMGANSIITGVTGTETLVNEAGHTIIGSGSITNLNLTNQGFIIASQSGTPLVIAPADGTLVNSGNGLLDAINGATLSINGNVSNSANVSVAQGSTLAVGQGRAYTQTAGVTDVNGTLMASAISINGGTLSGAGVIEGGAPGSPSATSVTISTGGALLAGEAGAPGTLAITGNLTFAGGTLDETISSASQGGFGVLDVSGALDLTAGGTLDVMLLNGFTPALGQNFEIAMANSLADPNGLFVILDPAIGNGEFWSVSSDPADLFLAVTSTPPATAAPEPGTLLLLGIALFGLAVPLRKRLTAGNN